MRPTGLAAMINEGVAIITERERAVLSLLAQGDSAKEIAGALDMSPRTVERNIENCRHKLQATNATQLVARSIDGGHVHLEEKF